MVYVYFCIESREVRSDHRWSLEKQMSKSLNTHVNIKDRLIVQETFHRGESSVFNADLQTPVCTTVHVIDVTIKDRF